MTKNIFIKFLISLSLFSTAFGQEAPFVLNEAPIENDQLLQATAGYAVYVDKTGRLYSAKLNGSKIKYLSGVTPENEDEIEEENTRLIVIAREKAEFAIVDEGDSQFVYFQGKERPNSYNYYLYKVNINGAALPKKVYKISQPGNQLTKSADSKKLFLSKFKNYLVDIANTNNDAIETNGVQELPTYNFAGTQSRITADFETVVYVAESQGAASQSFELRSYDIAQNKDRTLLTGFNNQNIKFEVSPDSSRVVVLRTNKDTYQQNLVTLKLDASELTQLYPYPDDQTSYSFDNIMPVPGIRGEGDAGAVLFMARAPQGSAAKLFLCDLNDYLVSEVKTGQVENETLSELRLTPDSSTLVYRRNSDTQRTLNYSLKFLDPEADPTYLFASSYTQSAFLEDSSSLIYVSSGAINDERNTILLLTLDGISSKVLLKPSLHEWIKPAETVSSVQSVGTSVVFTIADTTQTPVKYRILSFKR